MHCERCGQSNPPGEVFCTNTSCNAYLGWSKPSILPDASVIGEAQPRVSFAPPPLANLPTSPNLGTRPNTQPVPNIPPPRPPQPAAPARRRGLSALLTPAECEVAPGGGTATVLRIKNTGDVVEHPEISVKGVPAHWVTIDPQVVDVFVNTEVTVSLRFHPPKVADTPSGRVPFAVDATSTIPHPDTGMPESVTARQLGALTVGQFHDLAAVLRPLESESKRKANHTVLVANRGNAVERTMVVAHDRGDQIRFDLATPQLDLPAGRETALPVRLTTRRRKWVGGDKRHQFTVEVKGSQGLPTQLVGTMTQRPIIPRWLFALLTFAFVAGLAIGVPLVMNQLQKSDREQREREAAERQAEEESQATAPAAVPDVRNKPLAAALVDLTNAGFKVTQTAEMEQGGEPDTVASQDPPPGANLNKGQTVTLKIFAGVGEQLVPFLRGATEAQARQALADRGFTIVEVAPTGEFDPEVPAGSVIRTNPDASPARQKLDTPIQLIMSMGPPTIQVPGVSGKSVDDARNLLIDAGFVVGTNVQTEPTDDTTKVGVVLRVLMGGSDVGATALQGSSLDLVIGIAKTTSPVPELTGLPIDQALAALVAAELQLGIQTTESSDTVPEFQVIRFTPGAGQEIPKGSPVDVVVSSGPPVTVGAYTGLSQTDAIAAVQAAGLAPVIDRSCTDPSNAILSQSPDPGTVVQRNSQVGLYCVFFLDTFRPILDRDFTIGGG